MKLLTTKDLFSKHLTINKIINTRTEIKKKANGKYLVYCGGINRIQVALV
jgi:hypothetical protein